MIKLVSRIKRVLKTLRMIEEMQEKLESLNREVEHLWLRTASLGRDYTYVIEKLEPPPRAPLFPNSIEELEREQRVLDAYDNMMAANKRLTVSKDHF